MIQSQVRSVCAPSMIKRGQALARSGVRWEDAPQNGRAPRSVVGKGPRHLAGPQTCRADAPFSPPKHCVLLCTYAGGCRRCALCILKGWKLYSMCGVMLNVLEDKCDEGACCLAVYAPVISSSLHTNHISTLYGVAAWACRRRAFQISLWQFSRCGAPPCTVRQ